MTNSIYFIKVSLRFNTSFYFPRYTLNFMLIICTIHKIVNFLFSFSSLSPSIVFNFSLSFDTFVLAFFSSLVCFNFFFTVLLVFLEVHNSAVPEVSWIISQLVLHHFQHQFQYPHPVYLAKKGQALFTHLTFAWIPQKHH